MKFDMSRAWSEATAMIGANREVMLILAGIFFLLPNIALGFTMPSMEQFLLDPENAEGAMLAMYADLWWVMILVVVASIVGYLAMLALLRDDANPTVGEAIKAGFAGLLPAIATYILFALAVGLAVAVLVGVAAATQVAALVVVATIVGVVLAFYLAIKFILWAPIIAIDKIYNPIKVLGRSWRLTKGNSLRIFLFLALILIVYVVLAMVLGMVAGLLGAAFGSDSAMIVNAIVSGLVGAVVAVLFVAILAAIHRQLSGPSPEAISQTFE